MGAPTFLEARGRIEAALREVEKALSGESTRFKACTAREFYDYMTGDTYTGDKITLEDAIDSLYLTIHESWR